MFCIGFINREVLLVMTLEVRIPVEKSESNNPSHLVYKAIIPPSKVLEHHILISVTTLSAHF